MTQETVTQIVTNYYSDKIQLATLGVADLNCLLFKSTVGGLNEFKGYSVKLVEVPFETESDVRSVLDRIIRVNSSWFNS